ncbi:autotransporter outer membrane beta-barrel domain-containing protein [Nonlabens antarcticus]|uniref:autotransporter outer membrane beta-barrel domain-containing protein n=1 Tax=Nonlabens antarcticus TaxID=392714 RepID=UPI001890D6B3|nr:autotransporter outer membrane beta-barrel domain-containing protein [Nonlabens antarcticus]
MRQKLLLLLFLFPILVIAQTDDAELPLHLREIPKHNLSIDLGIAEPTGDYGNVARTGLTAGIVYDGYFNKNIGLSLGLHHGYNETAFTMQPNGPSPQNESFTQITAGVVMSKTINRFQVDGFARLGILFLDVNDTNGFASTNDDRFHFINGDTDDSSMVTHAGLRFNYYFRRGTQIYFSPQFLTSLGKPLVYNTSIERLSSNPTDLQGFRRESNLSNLLFTLGVKFAIGRKYTSGELRDDSSWDN